jgi:peptide/nickel transport system substrate-binding protein/oligopeptide transport system substrate-binding protein
VKRHRTGLTRLRNAARLTGTGAVVLAVAVLLTCTSANRTAGHVHYRIANDPTTLDPALVTDVNGGTIAAKLFNGLVRIGADLTVEADIAERWTVSRDGTTYRFFLRRDVTFSSGRPVHAGDFKYSFERVLDPETRSPMTWVFEHVAGAAEFMEGEAREVKGFRVVDEHTLEVELKRTFSPFLGLLTMPAAYVVPLEQVLLWGPDFSSHPVGTGPFLLSEWRAGRHVKLEARQDYFEGAPRTGGITYRVIPEELTAVAEFELGNLDVIAVPSSEYDRYRRSPAWRGLLSRNEGLNTYYLGMNCQKFPFDDPDVRRALSHAIDREKILMTLYEGRGRLASGPVPDLLRRWPEPEPYTFEPEEARRILAEKGAGKAEILFYIPAEPEVVDMAEVIQAYLREAGLSVGIRQLEWSAFKEAVNRGEPHLFWLSWWADYPDPENFLFPTFHSANHGPGGNRVRYTNAEVDALVERGRHSAREAERDEAYREAEDIIVRDAPWVFFWHKSDVSLRQPWVKRFSTVPVYSMDKGLDVSV